MPRSPSTYSLPPGTTPQQPNTVISSSMFNAFADDVAQTFNTVQPIVYGGTGSNDLKLTDTDFGIKDNGDPTKIGQFNASGLPTATTRTYDLPYYSGTLGLVSDIRGQIYGLTLSNNVTDATNDIDVTAGVAVNSTGAVSMQLLSGLTKRIDANWAVGTNQGGLDTGSKTNSTWYHFFIIRRPDTGVVDALFSASPTAPTLPANYTQFRRIGSVFVSNIGALALFRQDGDLFIYSSGITDRNSTSAFPSALLGLTVPSGIQTRPVVQVNVTTLTSADANVAFGDGVGAAVTANVAGVYSTGSGATAIAVVQGLFVTNTSSQVYFRAAINSGTLAGSNSVITLGWIDQRGRIS